MGDLVKIEGFQPCLDIGKLQHVSFIRELEMLRDDRFRLFERIVMDVEHHQVRVQFIAREGQDRR